MPIIGNSLSDLLPVFLLLGCLAISGCQVSSPPPGSSPTKLSPTSSVMPGDMRIDSKGIAQVWVPAGTFKMGTTQGEVKALQALNPPGIFNSALLNEVPQHAVTISKGYWIDKYEVTNAALKAFADTGGYKNREYWSDAGWKWLQEQTATQFPSFCLGDAPDEPAVCVTWFEAEAYARWRGGRLPTEAEWEFAARGPQSSIYPWGNEFDASRCNVVESEGPKAVGSFLQGASWVGALDMAGNVMEWVQDWLAPYDKDALVDPVGPAAGKVKVEKGGWWGSNLFAARSAYRHFEDPPDYGDLHIGFRIVSQ